MEVVACSEIRVAANYVTAVQNPSWVGVRRCVIDLVREVLGVDLSKRQQSSDWGSQTLSEAQLSYAASDVLHLHGLRERLNVMLAREGRTELAQACFDFLPTRAKLDLSGWENEDIFAHS